MATVGVDGSNLQMDSQPKSVGLIEVKPSWHVGRLSLLPCMDVK